MDAISSKYRKPKGRPNKKKKACAANARKRCQSSNETSIKIANENSNSVTTSEIVANENSYSVANSERDYLIMSNSVLSSLLKNIPCPDCKESALEITQSSHSLGVSCKITLTCSSCDRLWFNIYQ